GAGVRLLGALFEGGAGGRGGGDGAIQLLQEGVVVVPCRGRIDLFGERLGGGGEAGDLHQVLVEAGDRRIGGKGADVRRGDLLRRLLRAQLGERLWLRLRLLVQQRLPFLRRGRKIGGGVGVGRLHDLRRGGASGPVLDGRLIVDRRKDRHLVVGGGELRQQSLERGDLLLDRGAVGGRRLDLRFQPAATGVPLFRRDFAYAVAQPHLLEGLDRGVVPLGR